MTTVERSKRVDKNGRQEVQIYRHLLSNSSWNILLAIATYDAKDLPAKSWPQKRGGTAQPSVGATYSSKFECSVNASLSHLTAFIFTKFNLKSNEIELRGARITKS